MTKAALVAAFPGLKKSHLRLTSEATPDYNCIAWAADDNGRWWWPDPMLYWPDGVALNDELETFVAAFQTLGYEPCDSGNPERGFDKILFYGRAGKVRHAARQLPGGRWTSKLGDSVDIEHMPVGVEGEIYGQILQYMKRPTRAGK